MIINYNIFQQNNNKKFFENSSKIHFVRVVNILKNIRTKCLFDFNFAKLLRGNFMNGL